MKWEDLKPEVNGDSDKYSWNLYRYLRKHKGKVTVFKARGKPMLPYHIRLSSIPQCDDDCCRGKRLNGVGLNEILRGDFGEVHLITDVPYIDITKKFMREYRKGGVCFLYPNHTAYDFKWETRKRVRTCGYCGYKERKRVRYHREEYWVAAT